MNIIKKCPTCGELMGKNRFGYNDCIGCNSENFFDMPEEKKVEIKKIQEIKDPAVEITVEEYLSSTEEDDESLGNFKKPIL